MNFLDAGCQSGPFTEVEFGLCDDQNTQAYVDVSGGKKWSATVKNPDQKSVTFTAIDKCVIKDGEEEGRGRCDCMLSTEKALYLVELKDWRRGGWKSHACDQLESTIHFLAKTHGEQFLQNFSPKKAYACNRKSPFVEIDNQLKKRFSRLYQFRIDIQGTIKIE